jgi:hypothetical protein
VINIANRPMNVRRVAAIVNAIVRGEWVENGDSIRFSKTGVLLDGQHRLEAIRKTGVPQPCIIVSELDDDVFTTIDTGKSRNSSDVFAIAGIKNYNTAAAITRMFMIWEKCGHPYHIPSERRPSTDEVLTAYNERINFEKATAFVSTNQWLRKHMAPSICGFIYLIASKAGEEQGMIEFLKEVANPSLLPKSPVARMLREKLIENRAASRKLSQETLISVSIKSYKMFRDRENVKMLRIPSSIELEMFTI